MELSGSISVDGYKPSVGLEGRVIVYLSTVELLGAVLARLARGMAASAHFSVDRIRELAPVAETPSAHAHAAVAGTPLKLSISATNRRLELAMGPFRNGSSVVLDTDFGALVAELEVDRAGESETLRVVVSEARS